MRNSGANVRVDGGGEKKERDATTAGSAENASADKETTDKAQESADAAAAEQSKENKQTNAATNDQDKKVSDSMTN